MEFVVGYGVVPSYEGFVAGGTVLVSLGLGFVPCVVDSGDAALGDSVEFGTFGCVGWMIHGWVDVWRRWNERMCVLGCDVRNEDGHWLGVRVANGFSCGGAALVGRRVYLRRVRHLA